MLGWLTGAGALEGSEEGTADATFVEQPETPAPIFAMRAFKQVLFGTPQPVSTTRTREHATEAVRHGHNKSQTQRRVAGRDDVTPLQDDDDSASPVKPTGILMTPGTIGRRGKQVTFGESVVDNEGKKNKYSKSGIPDNCPGKFPSPWTPKQTAPVVDKAQDDKSKVKAETRMESKFRELIEPRKSLDKQKPASSWSAARSKDDGDLTVDLNLPRSTSGRYWKEQYDLYSTRSEAETRRLVAKHKMAKDYAKMKDDEADGLRSQLDLERKRRQKREKTLETQIKEMRERLRVALADNAKLTAEVTSLRMQLETVEAGRTNDSKAVPKHVASEHPKQLVMAPKSKVEIPANPASGDIWLDEESEREQAQRRRRLRRSAKTEQLVKEPVAQATPNIDKSVHDLFESLKSPHSKHARSRTQRTPRALVERSPNFSTKENSVEKTTVALHPTNTKQPQMTGLSHANIIQIGAISGAGLLDENPTPQHMSSRRKVREQKPPASHQVKGAENETRLDAARGRLHEKRRARREAAAA